MQSIVDRTAADCRLYLQPFTQPFAKEQL